MTDDCRGIKENGDPCDYTIWKDGYCRIHHPDRIDGVPDIETQDLPLTVRSSPGLPPGRRPPGAGGRTKDSGLKKCPKCRRSNNVRIRRQGSGIVSLVCSVCNINFTG